MQFFFTSVFILLSCIVSAQKVSYSKTINEDIDCRNFEILGNSNNNYLIYKRVRWKHMLAIYDKQMKQLRNRRLAFIPDQAFKVDFIVHQDFINVIYQFKENTTIFCKAAKINEWGEQVSEPILLDTAGADISGFNIRYFVTHSENRNKILLYKVMPLADSLLLHTMQYEPDLQLIYTRREVLPLKNGRYFYSPFVIDNNGTFFSIRSFREELLTKTTRMDLLIKYHGSPQFSLIEIPLPPASFSQLKIAIDNLNKRYVLNSLFSAKNSSTVDGLFTSFIIADTTARITSSYNLFSDTLRKTLNATQGLRAAFNTLVLRNVTLKKDGGFRITAEDCFELIYKKAYSLKSGNLFPNYANGDLEYQLSFSEYFPFPKLYTDYLSEERFFFNNILAIDVDSALHVKANTVIYKAQVGAEGFHSFGTFTTGAETHFLFSGYKTPKVIYNYALLGDGSSKSYAPFKTQAAGYTIMPVNLKQVGAKHVIIPGFYRNVFSFALVDFSQTLQSEY